MHSSAVVSRVLHWYDENARDLPWRRPEATPWQIMVSEYMLQQTPVERVLRPWQDWVERWPSPTALSQAPAGEAIRGWGRLGYPRRAVRLHAAATVIAERHEGKVPADHAQLLSLPGVGPYTAAAIASFAFGHRYVVLDTNVRRVLARVRTGVAYPGDTTTAADTAVAQDFLPRTSARAARWAAASMELGATVCTARSPRCPDCPVQGLCAWRLAGSPDWAGPPRRGQHYAGTDRQCRGVLLAVLRSTDRPVQLSQLHRGWPDPVQSDRALLSLLADGLAIRFDDASVALPS